MGFKVFVSHSMRDNEIVFSLYSLLKQSGLEVYAAPFNLEPGQLILRKILKEIETADCVLVILTSNAKKSASVMNEIRMARKSHKLIIPIVYKGVRVPEILERVEYIKLDPKMPLTTMRQIDRYFRHLKPRSRRVAKFGLGLAALMLGLSVLASVTDNKK